MIGTGVLFIGYWFFRKATAIKLLTFAPGAINSMSFLGVSPVLSLSLTVQNTSSTDLTINSLAGEVSANGTNVGTVYNFQPTIIPANSLIQLPVTIQFALSSLVNQLVQDFQTKNFSQNILLEGSANVEGVQLPVNLQFSIGA